MGTEPITDGLKEPGGGGACWGCPPPVLCCTFEPGAEGAKGWAGRGVIPEAGFGAGGPGFMEPVVVPVWGVKRAIFRRVGKAAR
jgi:hypothetical protein